MTEDIYDSKERARIVAKDILAASELVNHPNFRYTPSKQLQDLMSAEEIATTIMHLNRVNALRIDTRSMYNGGYLQTFPAYNIQTDKHALEEIIEPAIIALDATDYPPGQQISYSPSDRTLTIDGKRLKIRGDMMANLCETVLTCPDKSKVWSNDEVFESWGWPGERIFDEDLKVRRENRLKIYQQARELNKQIVLFTSGKIEGLFDYSTKSVSIDEKYRENVS